MNYIKQKRNQKDRCNICGKTAELPWDHIPPKSILTEPNTYANTLFSKSSPPSPNQYMKHYQSGIKYRTICAECNNVILGKNDKALQEFSEEVVKRIELSVSCHIIFIALPLIFFMFNLFLASAAFSGVLNIIVAFCFLLLKMS